MSSPAGSDNIIDRACKSAGVSRDGSIWLKWGLNPFGDNPENLAGYPDDCMSDSVPQVVKQQLTIAAPSGITVGSNWDCHIVHLPWRSPVPLVNANPVSTTLPIADSYPAGNCFNLGGNPTYVGGLQIMAGPAGTSFNFTAPNNWSPSGGFASASSYSAYLCPDPTFTSGTCRIIGSGWEVHNTTADIYKQGAVTVYRQPVPNQTMVSSAFIQVGAVPNINKISTTIPALYAPHPPLSLSDALLYRDSKTWKASEGVYAVDMFHDTDIKPQGAYFVQPLLTAAGTNVSPTYYCSTPSCSYATVLSAGGPDPGAQATQAQNWPDVFWTQSEQTGAWFTGLSNNTTLTINILTLIERFPTIGDDPNLLVVASPSAMDDALARRIYADTIRLLPIAVPVRQNGLGEWIKNAATTVMKVVRPMIRGSGHLGLNAALTGADFIYGLGKNSKGGRRSRDSAAPSAAGKVSGNDWVDPSSKRRPKQKSSVVIEEIIEGKSARNRKKRQKKKARKAAAGGIPKAPPLGGYHGPRERYQNPGKFRKKVPGVRGGALAQARAKLRKTGNASRANQARHGFGRSEGMSGPLGQFGGF